MKLLLRAAAVAISVALFVWLVADARWQGVGDRLARLDMRALAGVALLFAASYAMRAARIAGEFRDEIDAGADGRVVRYLRILRLTLVHNALVNLLPFRTGEAAFPVLLTRWFGIGTARAVVSLLWLRAQDAAVVAVLAALAWPGLAVGWRIAAVVAVAAGAVGVPWWARRRSGRSGAGRLRDLLARATASSASGWAWTVANWTVKLFAEAWLVWLALGGGEPGVAGFGVPFLGAIGAELAAILPVQGVAGFGTFEAGSAALMRTGGLALSTGLEAALVLHAVVLVLSSAAGGLALLLPRPAEVDRAQCGAAQP